MDWYREAVVSLGHYSGVETSAGLLSDVVAVVGTFFQKQRRHCGTHWTNSRHSLLYGHRRLFRELHVFSVYCIVYSVEEERILNLCLLREGEKRGNVRQLVVGPLCALLVDWYREAVVSLGHYSVVETSAGPD